MGCWPGLITVRFLPQRLNSHQRHTGIYRSEPLIVLHGWPTEPMASWTQWVTSSGNIGMDWSPIVIICRWFRLSHNRPRWWVLLMYRSSSRMWKSVPWKTVAPYLSYYPFGTQLFRCLDCRLAYFVSQWGKSSFHLSLHSFIHRFLHYFIHLFPFIWLFVDSFIFSHSSFHSSPLSSVYSSIHQCFHLSHLFVRSVILLSVHPSYIHSSV